MIMDAWEREFLRVHAMLYRANVGSRRERLNAASMMADLLTGETTAYLRAL